ncbi:MAG: sugar transferase [Acidimicrobiia bacterium]
MGDVERRGDAHEGGEGVARLHAVPTAHSASPYERFVKPVVDRVAGVLLTVVTFPIVVVVGIAVALSMGRPVLFRQRRVGRFGEEFWW